MYNWLKQERIDRGEILGMSIDQALGFAAAKRRIRQLETELAVSRKVDGREARGAAAEAGAQAVGGSVGAGPRRARPPRGTRVDT